jgi:hypothetical protein
MHRLAKQGFKLKRSKRMTRTLAVLATAVTLGATTMVAPAQARGIGPGLAFGLAAGAITAGAIAATSPYYYGPGYAYGPGYYYGPGPAYYGPGPYAYYGGPHYYRHHYWRQW